MAKSTFKKHTWIFQGDWFADHNFNWWICENCKENKVIHKKAIDNHTDIL